MARHDPASVEAALVALYRERHAELRRDPEALAWSGLRVEAALDVLGGDATADAINALLEAGRSIP